MPKQLPQIPGFQLAGGYEPARIVAGDYYDAIRLSDSRLVIAIGDVSGKGMAAALLMSNLQAIVRAFAPGGPSPVELCTKANQLIAANVAPGKYITFFYAVVDAAGMRLEYCNAGHNPPLLQRLDGTLETLVEGGPVLGIFPGAGYSFGVVELKHGDRLLVFTDGITEAMNAADEEFGEGRLRDVFAQRFESAGQCYRQVMTEVTRFTGGTFSDDATLMVMTVN